jgi:DNA repair exonuclease SbcCD nuclease subunit
MIITGAILLMAVLFSRAFVTLYQLLQRVLENLGVENWLDYTLATGLIVALIYFIGWRLVLVRNANNWLKSNALPIFQAYGNHEDTGKSGAASLSGSQSVLVYINGGWQPALVIERAVMGAYVVYVPKAPHAHSGDIYVVESFQVKPLNMSIPTMQDTIEHFGKGLSVHTGKLFETG